MNTIIVVVLLGYCCMHECAYPGYDRNITKVIGVKGSGWGSWGPKQYCMQGMYATAFTLKVQGPSKPVLNDETALNGVKLHCTGAGNPETTITSKVGDFGTWRKKQYCYSSDYKLASFELTIEPNQGDADDSAANNLSFWCRNERGIETFEKGSSSTRWGKKERKSAWCPHGSWICGLQTRVEDYQGTPWADDTAMNDLKVFCCNDRRNVK